MLGAFYLKEAEKAKRYALPQKGFKDYPDGFLLLNMKLTSKNG